MVSSGFSPWLTAFNFHWLFLSAFHKIFNPVFAFGALSFGFLWQDHCPVKSLLPLPWDPCQLHTWSLIFFSFTLDLCMWISKSHVKSQNYFDLPSLFCLWSLLPHIHLDTKPFVNFLIKYHSKPSTDLCLPCHCLHIELGFVPKYSNSPFASLLALLLSLFYPITTIPYTASL